MLKKDVYKCIRSVLFYSGPAVIHPQYYSVQAPWLYPANLIQQGQQPHPGAAAQSAAAAALSQQQQQQLLRGQSGRPVTPQQQSENIPASALQAQALQTPSKIQTTFII